MGRRKSREWLTLTRTHKRPLHAAVVAGVGD
jgi:hypothetical protein